MEASGLAPRRAALDLVTAVTSEGRLLPELAADRLEELPPGERARANRLAVETLRWAGRADRVLGPFLRNRPYPRAHNLLRLAVWEMRGDGAAAYGVVNAAVALAKQHPHTRRTAGLVNAVLRKVADGEGWDDLALPQLPKWLRKPLIVTYGKQSVEAMERAHAATPPVDLTLRPGAPEDLAATLGATPLPMGSLRLAAPGQISALPGFAEGHWWVQDAAATLPARILAPQPGERVADLCAAPGGKTMQLAGSGAKVTAVDVSERRMAQVSENLARTQLSADCVVADVLKWEPDAPFDGVLLDAPCSATGTIRRHPDLPHAKDASVLAELSALQGQMIDRALGFLRPGGRLVYCTCSLFPEEGEVQIEAALSRHKGLSLDLDALSLEGVDPDWIGPLGLRTRPDFWSDTGGIDGFFITCLRKIA